VAWYQSRRVDSEAEYSIEMFMNPYSELAEPVERDTMVILRKLRTPGCLFNSIAFP
jgi:spore cortex formation protein SpoVR/YcgB (stage V sporulation)